LAEWDRIMQESRPAIQALIDEYGEENVSWIESPKTTHISYPVNTYPEKVVSLSLDKTPTVSGKLLGIKGQYLYFEHGVMNVRKFGGYEVDFLT
jgi:hypothetical protein